MNATEIIPNLWMGGQVAPVLDGQYGAVVNLRILEDLALPMDNATRAQKGPVCLWMPLVDEPLAPPGWKVFAGAAFVHTAVGNGVKTLVHCEEGRNRSGLIVGAYLILYQKLKPNQAIALIQQKRPNALSNEVFRTMLEEL